jgi:broad specificity phosphatase PhoE
MYLVRHGATDQNDCRPIVLQGHGINGPLNANGLRQASAVAEALANQPIQAIYASPMLRAQMTAEAIASRHHLPVHTVPLLHEVNVGTWEGMSWQQIQEQDPEHYSRFLGDPYVAYRGGESYADVLERVRQVLRELLVRHAGQRIVVVAHNVVNRVYLTELLGLPLQASRHLKQMNCCVNLIRHSGDVSEVVSLNSILHLPEF